MRTAVATAALTLAVGVGAVACGAAWPTSATELVSGTPSRAEQASRADPGLCRSGERVVYNCEFGDETASVCAGGGKAHFRKGRSGKSDLSITSAPGWDNVHLGNVVGQQGGHQNHIRFTQGTRHYLVFEGVDGALADSPGRRYSGVTLLEEVDGGMDEMARLCPQDGERLDPEFDVAITNQMPETLRDGVWEVPGSLFDGWF